MKTTLTRLGFLAVGLAAALAPAEAKNFNVGNGVPSSSQAIINRVFADMATTGDSGGQYGAFESDCNDLNVGANTADGRPDSQIIVADTIINAGGQCRMVRHNGLFAPKDSAAPPAKPAPSPTKR